MASSKDYLIYVLELLHEVGDISYKKMMGEYILYKNDVIFGGIYDNRFLVKPVKAALEMMPDAERQLPYDGAKEMLLVEDVEDRELLKKLFERVASDLLAKKK